jgi:hypothetical protein
MKKISSFAITLAISASTLSPLAVFASTNYETGGSEGSTTKATLGDTRGERGEHAKHATSTASTTASASTMIAKRIASLNKLQTRITGMKKLSDAQKAAFTATITANINDLTALDAKIKADTDPAVLAADKASISKAYRLR